MAELSKVVAIDGLLPLIAARVQVPARACKTATSDLGIWGGGDGSLDSLVSPTTYSWLVADQPKYGRKSDDSRNLVNQSINEIIMKPKGNFKWV